MRGITVATSDWRLLSRISLYYVPLYRRIVARTDLKAKIFFTWHAAEKAQHDPGFGREVAWDIPLTEGYDYEADRIPRLSQALTTSGESAIGH